MLAEWKAEFAARGQVTLRTDRRFALSRLVIALFLLALGLFLTVGPALALVGGGSRDGGTTAALVGSAVIGTVLLALAVALVARCAGWLLRPAAVVHLDHNGVRLQDATQIPWPALRGTHFPREEWPQRLVLHAEGATYDLRGQAGDLDDVQRLLLWARDRRVSR